MKSNEKFSQRAEIAIEAARAAAGELGHAYIGTEHLLLGIMEEQDGLGAHILRREGLEREHLRRVIARESGLGCPGAPGLGLTPNARKALEQLPKLRGCEAHMTVIPSSVDDGIFRRLGVQITYEPHYQVSRLYHV